MRRFAVVLAAIAVAVPMACGPKKVQPLVQIPPALKIAQTDNGKILDVERGRRIEIALRGNPSTGYQWMLMKKAAGVGQLGQPAFKPDSKQIGAPGLETLRFRAIRSGRSVIALGWRRPWEKNVPPARTFSVTLIVR